MLASLLRRRMRSEDDVFSAMGDLTSWVLGEHYQAACLSPSEVHEHLPLLNELARDCKVVAEIGSLSGATTLALLWAAPRRLIRLDDARRADEQLLRSLAGRAELVFQVGDLQQSQPEETDLLFVGLGTGQDLKNGFLERHVARVRKYVLVHGTAGTNGNGRGQAVESLLAGGTFRVRERRENNGGLTVLERVTPASPSN